MKDLIKAIDGLPKIVRFLGTLIWGILANIYRLCRKCHSKTKQNVLGVVLAIILLLCGGFFILWIIDLVCILLDKPIWWID